MHCQVLGQMTLGNPWCLALSGAEFHGCRLIRLCDDSQKERKFTATDCNEKQLQLEATPHNVFFPRQSIWSVEFFDGHPGVSLDQAQESSSSSALISISPPMTDLRRGGLKFCLSEPAVLSGNAGNIPGNIKAFFFDGL